MKRFILESNIEFMADNIDDAAKKLAEYFARMGDYLSNSHGDEDFEPGLVERGRISIHPIKSVHLED